MLRQIIRTDNVDLTVEAGGVRHCFSPQNVPQEDQGAVALLPQILRNREVNAAPEQQLADAFVQIMADEPDGPLFPSLFNGGGTSGNAEIRHVDTP